MSAHKAIAEAEKFLKGDIPTMDLDEVIRALLDKIYELEGVIECLNLELLARGEHDDA